MALTLSIAQGSPAGPVVANQPMTFVVTVTNTATAAVTLNSLTVSPGPGDFITLSQPNFQTPTTAIGSPGYPVLLASGNASYPFSAVFAAPNMPGISPNNPGGAAPGQTAMEAYALYVIQAQAVASDGSVGSVNFTVPVLSAVAPFPVPTGGAAQFGLGTGSDVALLAAIS